MSDVKHPEVSAQLTGVDGNAMSIISTVTKAMRRANVSKDEIDTFVNEAISGDYDNVLSTCMRWVLVS